MALKNKIQQIWIYGHFSLEQQLILWGILPLFMKFPIFLLWILENLCNFTCSFCNDISTLVKGCWYLLVGNSTKALSFWVRLMFRIEKFMKKAEPVSGMLCYTLCYASFTCLLIKGEDIFLPWVLKWVVCPSLITTSLWQFSRLLFVSLLFPIPGNKVIKGMQMLMAIPEY